MNALKQRLSTAFALLAALLLVTGCTTVNMPGAGNNITRPTITGPVPIMKAQGGAGPSARKLADGCRHRTLWPDAREQQVRATQRRTWFDRGNPQSRRPLHSGPPETHPRTNRTLGRRPRHPRPDRQCRRHRARQDHRVARLPPGKHSYQNIQRGQRDAYQNLYNAISNDLLAYRNSLGTREIDRLRTLSKLKWAADIAPDAFGDTIAKNIDGTYKIRRLPAEGDPMFERLMAMREREAMVVDLMNEHYEDYYNEMWEPYSNWREFSREEAENLKEVKAKSRNRKLLGAAVLVGTIAAEVLSNGEMPGALTQVGVIGGIEAIRSGMSIGQEAEMHREALTELGESFGADIEPRVVTIEGKTLELRGTATEQYAQWRDLLRQIYAEETGFPVAGPSVDYAPPAAGPAPSPVQNYGTGPAPAPAPAPEPGGGYTYPELPAPGPAPAPAPGYPETAPQVPSSSGEYYPETGEIPEIDPELDPELNPEIETILR